VLQVKYTYTNGFVTQTDYGNGLRRTATPDLDFGLPATTVTTNPQSQTIESTQNNLSTGIYHLRFSTIASKASWENYGISHEWRLGTTGQDWDDGAQTGGGQLWWDSLSNARRIGAQDLIYNAEANRLTEVRDTAAPNTVRHTYAYDPAGFVTDRDGVTLSYDATGAIASVGSVAAFDHDLDGRPISRTLNGVTKIFRFGGAIAYSTAGTPIEIDLGEIVIKLDGSTNRYRHTDFRCNVLFQTNAAGAVTGQAVYRGFGRFMVDGNLGERGFAGGFEIASLGLVVLGPRVLDSDTGRFLSQDPVFNAVNQYAYTQGNPVFLWDPAGRDISGLGSLAFVGFFTLSFITSGGEMPGQTVPGPPPATPPSENPNNSQLLAGGLLMMTGLGLIEVGEKSLEIGVAFAPVTGGRSLVGGFIAYGAFTTFGVAGTALGAAICHDALAGGEAASGQPR
jgi:RHS repeat-associated protein